MMSYSIVLYALLLVIGFGFIASNSSLILRAANMDLVKIKQSRDYSLQRRINLKRVDLEKLRL